MQIGHTIYLDYQASTPLDPSVRELMQQHETESFANPHSTGHVLGQKAAEVVETARADVESFIGAAPEEIIFTSGATESNNQAIFSVLHAN